MTEVRIERHLFSTDDLERLLKDQIFAALGSDKDALKAFEVKVFRPETIEQARALKELGTELFVVSGLLGLDDSGVGYKYFSVNIEQGHDIEGDKSIGREMGIQCAACVRQLKKERKKNRGLHIVR